MFLKPFKVKTQTTIKGSDRKKLRTDIGLQYQGIGEERLNELVPAKEEMSTMKIETHSHETIFVYSFQKNPIFFQVDKVIYPTVYLLWRCPELMLTFTTHAEVLKRLQGGADLMLPGVIVPNPPSPTALGNFPKDHGCAVKLSGNRAAVAVGKTALSSSDMFDSGMRGKGVTILHTYQDHLWELGDRTELPQLPEEVTAPAETGREENLTGAASADGPTGSSLVSSSSLVSGHGSTTATDTEDGSLADQLQGELKLSSDGEAVSFGDVGGACGGGDPCHVAVNLKVDGEAVADGVDEAGAQQEEELNVLSPQESMEDLLHQCFLYALRTNARRVELPLLTSTFFRNHMVPCCPKGKALDVKKSSFKKLSKFLAARAAERLIEVKELSKGVESIVKIDYEHDSIRFFRIPDWPLAEQEHEEEVAPVGSNYAPPQVTDVYLVTVPVLPLMSLVGKGKGVALTAQEVRQIVMDYVKENNLQDAKTKRFVNINPVLSQVLLNKGEFADVLHFEELVPRCIGKMTTGYQITFPGKDPLIRKGQLEPVTLDVKMRGSNKKVTTVDYLELYGIDPVEFASAVQKGGACSASVAETEDKTKGEKEVIVQGNQIKFIGTLLKENYRLPLKFIKGLEKAPKKK